MASRPISPRTQVEQEKRIRREIANSNERRRMQSINTGFNSLRTMLPKHDGEKLSKAAILQHTAEYIYQLEQDKTRLLGEICTLKRAPMSEVMDVELSSATKKMKVEDRKPLELCNSDFSDEGIHCQASPKESLSSGAENELSSDELRIELIQTRKILERERRLRMQLEDQVRSLESQLYPERIKEIANQVQLQFQARPDDELLVSSFDQDETLNAVSSVVPDQDQEVVETIEIETHSCAGSPELQNTTIVIQQNQMDVDDGEMVQDLTKSGTRLSSRRKSTSGANSKSGAPAAIALPIDVPYVPAGGDESNPTTVTVQIISGNGDNQMNGNSRSRQNLETIVEAIRHLEGDYLFQDDSNEKQGVTQANMMPKQIKTENGNVLTVSPQQLGAIRKQVIQCVPLQSRPAVIIANKNKPEETHEMPL